MNCSICGKEVNEKKSFTQMTYIDSIVEVMHNSCYGRKYPEEKDDE